MGYLVSNQYKVWENECNNRFNQLKRKIIFAKVLKFNYGGYK